MITLKTERELKLMREAGRIVALALDEVAKAVAPGITTAELDAIAEKTIVSCGARPSFKGYNGFPASICASINHEVVHGIPGLKRLRDGDIISIDVGAEINGYHGDAARTFPVGIVSPLAQRLITITEEALAQGIAAFKPGGRLTDISHAIQSYVEAAGFSVVRDLVGHGIGRKLHEAPQVPNYGRPGRGTRLTPGLVLAIEPMVNVGTYAIDFMPDQWTVVTADGSLSAHAEHTVALLEDGPLVLTKP
ncbi:MAG TPA: type I methionyl aminopeptidase [Firmicutes bacterium]|jgi:methionyl aminopeptidase|nr:type I methionyl aminopeptidase [Bacillota bacterium]